MGGEKVNDFESIYNTYLKDVFRYSKSLCLDEQMAEEITEETFFRALRSLGSFRGECEVRVWLCGIARNVWLSEQKKRSRFDDGDDALERLGDGRDLAAEFADRDTARRRWQALFRRWCPSRTGRRATGFCISAASLPLGGWPC
jgi:RNA polymerase sigma-70 factor (ECF subfamily)